MDAWDTHSMPRPRVPAAAILELGADTLSMTPLSVMFDCLMQGIGWARPLPGQLLAGRFAVKVVTRMTAAASEIQGVSATDVEYLQDVPTANLMVLAAALLSSGAGPASLFLTSGFSVGATGCLALTSLVMLNGSRLVAQRFPDIRDRRLQRTGCLIILFGAAYNAVMAIGLDSVLMFPHAEIVSHHMLNLIVWPLQLWSLSHLAGRTWKDSLPVVATSWLSCASGIAACFVSDPSLMYAFLTASLASTALTVYVYEDVPDHGSITVSHLNGVRCRVAGDLFLFTCSLHPFAQAGVSLHWLGRDAYMQLLALADLVSLMGCTHLMLKDLRAVASCERYWAGQTRGTDSLPSTVVIESERT